MENATKALMIAGAILVALLIIGIAMAIYTNSQGVFSNVNSRMSQQEIQVFNQQFENYEGTQSGSSVKALIGTILTNNSVADQNGEEEEKAVSLTIDGGKAKEAKTSAELSSARTEIIAGKKYTVEFEYKDGLINKVTVKLADKKDNSSSGTSTGN